MRKLFWFVLGFLAACAFSVNFGSRLLAFMVAACGVVVFAFFRSKGCKAIFIGSIGLLTGFLWFIIFHQVYINPVARTDQNTIHLSITASEYGEDARYAQSVYGYTQIGFFPYRVRVYIKESDNLMPGDIIEGDFRVRVTTPEGEKGSAYYRGDGVLITATQNGNCQIEKTADVPLWCIPSVIAKNLKDAIRKTFPDDTRAFAKALLLGDTSDLTYAQDSALKISGIRHIVAVSGLHVSALFAVILLLFRWNRLLTLVLTAPVLFLFSAITGFSPSVVRASLMAIITVLGSIIYEEYDGLTGLSLAALIMMIINPYVVESVSFQLSFASVFGILLFSSKLYNWLQSKKANNAISGIALKIRTFLAATISVSISAQVITTPFSAFYFGSVSLIGLLTNLVTIWLIMPIFCGVAIAACFGLFLPTVGAVIGDFVSIPIRFVLFISNCFSKIPYAAVYTQSVYILIWVILCYLLLIILLLYGKRYLRFVSITAVIGLCIAIAGSVVIPASDIFRATILDVGEGQCILLQSMGHSFLVDCGGEDAVRSANIVVQTLESQGIHKLDGITFTHYDSDHCCATENILTRVRTNAIYYPVLEDRGFIEKINRLIDCESAYISDTTSIPFGSGTITLYAPGNAAKDNENCMCVLFETKNCAILITGDRGFSGEKALLGAQSLPDVDILVGGHHGSKNSTSSELLSAVLPEIVVFSVGSGNSYGHPSDDVVKRVSDYGCVVYRTDVDGSVLLRR